MLNAVILMVVLAAIVSAALPPIHPFIPIVNQEHVMYEDGSYSFS